LQQFSSDFDFEIGSNEESQALSDQTGILSPPRMPRLVVLPRHQHLRLDQLHEIPRLLRQLLPLPHHHPIARMME
jgi:hypothetical protein